MSIAPTRCVVTSRDFARLELFARTKMSVANPIRRILIEKLDTCDVVSADDIPTDIARLGSRITVRIFERAPETRILVHPDGYPDDSLSLPVTMPLGLALFGLSAGDSAVFAGYGGHAQRAQLVAVEQVPTAAPRPAHGAPNGLRDQP